MGSKWQRIWQLVDLGPSQPGSFDARAYAYTVPRTHAGADAKSFPVAYAETESFPDRHAETDSFLVACADTNEGSVFSFRRMAE